MSITLPQMLYFDYNETSYYGNPYVDSRYCYIYYWKKEESEKSVKINSTVLDFLLGLESRLNLNSSPK